MEYLTNLWNNQPNILNWRRFSNISIVRHLYKITRYLSVKINSQGWSLLFSMGAIICLLLI